LLLDYQPSFITLRYWKCIKWIFNTHMSIRLFCITEFINASNLCCKSNAIYAIIAIVTTLHRFMYIKSWACNDNANKIKPVVIIIVFICLVFYCWQLLFLLHFIVLTNLKYIYAGFYIICIPTVTILPIPWLSNDAL